MAWLDDRIRDHPKFVELSDRAFREWAHALCYCSQHGTGGRLDAAIKALRIPKTIVRELVRAGIWDEEDDGLWVHDWQEHNEKRDQAREDKREQARERQRRHREKVRASRTVTRDSHADVTRDSGRDITRDKSVTALAGARASRARDHEDDHGDVTPTGPPSSSEVAREIARQALDDDDLEQAFRALGPSNGQLARWQAAADEEPERIRAAVHAAIEHGTRAAPYLDEIVQNGSWPETATDDQEPKVAPLPEAWQLFLAGHSWDDSFDEQQILEEFEKRRRGRPGDLTDDQALEQWRAARSARYPHDDDLDPEPTVSTTTAPSTTVQH